jgi:hypothetical protein
VSNTVCGIFIAHADAECQCGGAAIGPPPIINTTPTCALCGSNRVPEIRAQELVETGIAGEMLCRFLEQAAADGFLPASLCPILKENVADICCTPSCTLGVNCPTPNPTPAPVALEQYTPAPAAARACNIVQDGCENDSDCCGALICRLRAAGGDIMTCSSTSGVRGGRTSIAPGSRGGQGGVSKINGN